MTTSESPFPLVDTQFGTTPLWAGGALIHAPGSASLGIAENRSRCWWRNKEAAWVSSIRITAWKPPSPRGAAPRPSRICRIREATTADVAVVKQRRDQAEREAAEQPAVKVAPQRAGKPSEGEDIVAKRHGLYTADSGKTRTYFADYQQKREVMRADPLRIRTKHDDRQTVAAVLDPAQDRGWTTLRLRGTEDFRREAWVQASIRGMQTQGYKPSETDKQELERRRAALMPTTKAENAAAKPVPVRAASPQAVWSEVQAAGDKARTADVAKQGERQGQGRGQQGKQKAEEQAPAQALQQAAA